MLQILLVTFPFFALVLCGYLAARGRLVPLDAIPGLNVFVLFFALPCMLYRFAANTPIARLLDFSAFGVYLASGLLLVGITIATTRRGRIGWNDASFGALVAAFPNSGFMGVPLLVKLLGDRVAAPVIVTLAVDMVITSSLCVALSRLDATDSHGARRAAINAIRGVAVNPLPWAIILGYVSSASGQKLPGPAMTVVSMLADAASPTALFTIGAVLARPQPVASAERTGRRSDVLQVVAYKLVAHPLLLLAVGSSAVAAGLPLDRFVLTVLTLVAALPSASNVPMLAERFGADTGRVARVVLLSTALAFATFSMAVALAMRFG